MQFTSPVLLGSLALVLPYVWLRLRQRRPPIAVVSSLLLWKAVPPAPQDVLSRRERLWNLVLLVEGASLALVCASLAGPWLRGEARRPVHLVLAIDDSASLATGDRWKRLQARAEELIGDLDRDDVVTLLTNDREEEPLASIDARSVVRQLKPREIEDDLEGLLARVRALVAGEEGAVARVLTDRAVLGAAEVESFGEPVDNAGIVDASVEDGGMFVSIASTAPRKLRVEINPSQSPPGIDQRPHADSQVEVSGAGFVPVFIGIDIRNEQSVDASLFPGDDLGWDNLVGFRRRPRITVRLDSPGNPELARALAVQPGVTLVQGSSGPADLVVLDRVWPGALPKEPCVLIAPPESCSFRGEEVHGPFTTWEWKGTILEGVDFESVGLVKGHAFAGKGISLATSGERTLIALSETPPLLYIGFDVSLAGGEATWATHPHFPVFWNHVVTQMAGGTTEWVRTSGLCSRRETLCASESAPGGPLDTRRTAVVSSPRFLSTYALLAAALGFAFAHFLLRRTNGCPTSSSSTTR